MSRFALSLAISLVALSATAQVYSWKDADGKIHYSDQPPAGKSKDSRKLGPAVQAPEGAAEARQAQAEKAIEERKDSQKAKEAAAKAEKDKAAAAEKKQQCERAKTALSGLESGATRFTTGPNGERVALDGAARAAEVANARKAADSWCK